MSKYACDLCGSDDETRRDVKVVALFDGEPREVDATLCRDCRVEGHRVYSSTSLAPPATLTAEEQTRARTAIAEYDRARNAGRRRGRR